MEPTELARKYMQVWNANEADILDVYASRDIEVEYTHFDKVVKGIADYKVLLKLTYDFFPDLTIRLEEVVAKENMAVVRWQYSGTHKHGVLFGKPAAGKRVAVRGVTFLYFKSGVVIRESGVVDNLRLLIQIGALQP